MKTISRFLLAITPLLFLTVTPARATTVYALTDGGDVLTFDHLTPGTITNDVPITNLGGYELLAIDVRPTVQPSYSQPGVGSLWGIGRSGTSFQLFVINPGTGAATAIGSPILAGINSAPANTSWGFDFNPSVDRIRLVNSSASNDNYRLNPNNGQLVFTDTPLAYAAGDAHFGTTPEVDGAAYTSGAFGGSTSLYYIDTGLNILAVSPTPNDGQLQTVGALGVDIDQPNGFDIYGGLALFSVPIVGGSSLYSIDLATGAATAIGDFPALTSIRGLAISATVPPPPVPAPPFLRIVGPVKRTTSNSRVDLKIRSHDDSGVVAVSFRAVKQSHSYKSLHSSTSLYIAKVRGLKFGNNRVIARSTDPEGNLTVKHVVIKRVP